MVFSCSLESCIAPGFARLIPDKIFINPQLPPIKSLRWASLLKEQSPQEAAQILKELKMDNDTIDKVKLLVKMCPIPIGLTPAQIRRAMSQMPDELFDSLLLLKRSLTACGETDRGSENIQTSDAIPDKILPALQELDQIRRTAREIRLRGDCINLKMLAVTGKDLITHGMKPGKQLGETLKNLLNLVIEHPELNQKETLLTIINSPENLPSSNQ